jgi:hypothetical protein
MISLKKILLEEEEYITRIPSPTDPDYIDDEEQSDDKEDKKKKPESSVGDTFCRRGGKTTPLTIAQERSLRGIMLGSPTEEQETKIKEIFIKSQIGQFCKDAGNLANKYRHHGITRDDLISAGLVKLIELSWPAINWTVPTRIGTFLADSMRGHMTNFANKEVNKKGFVGLGDEKSDPVKSMDAPIPGGEDDMTAHDIIGGSFDDPVEEADLMERIYRSIKKGIKPHIKSAPSQIATLRGFLGIDENDRFTGDYRNVKDLEKDLGINHASIRVWWKAYEDYLKKLKQKQPDLFNEEKDRMKKIAGIK